MKVTDIRQSGRVLTWDDSLFQTVPYLEAPAFEPIPIGEATELWWAHPGMFEATEPAALGE